VGDGVRVGLGNWVRGWVGRGGRGERGMESELGGGGEKRERECKVRKRVRGRA